MQPDLATFQHRFVEAIDRPAIGALAVYRNTVLHGAVQALRANYPVVEQILGAEMFDQIAVEHASACPPRSPVLALYGDSFADWLSRQPWVGDLPYLPDVARVERLRTECQLAADCAPLTQAQLRRARRLPDAQFGLHPAVRFAWLSTPAMTLWLAHQRPLTAELAPDWKAEGALFARPEPFEFHACRIGPAAHRLLHGVRLGESLNASVAAASKLYPEEDCTAVLASLVNLGVLAAPTAERTC